MKKGSVTFIAGVLTGALMFGGTAAFAGGIVANPSADRVFVNGQPIQADVYKIGGANYFKLRDIAAAVNFGVEYDPESTRVLIDTSKPYDETAQPASSSPSQPMSVDEMRAEVIRLVNAERIKAGLPELTVLPALADCAQAKADDMKANNYYGHTSPVYGTPGEMVRSFVPNAVAVGENLAPGTGSPEEAFAGWLDPEHYANIISVRYNHTGGGVIAGADGKFWWVLDLAQLP